MAEKSTFIKIDRNITEWRWFRNSRTYHVFSWLIIMANIKDHEFMHNIVKRGSIATSYETIADACGMSISSVRRAIANLEQTKEIERKVKDHYQIITILKYDEYQSTAKVAHNEQPRLLNMNTDPVHNEQDPVHIEQQSEQQSKNIKNIRMRRKKNKEKESASSSPLDGGADAPKATRLKPIDEGTDDDIPVEFRDFCKTYADYWRFRNR